MDPILTSLLDAGSRLADVGALAIVGGVAYFGSREARRAIWRLIPRRMTWRDWCQHIRIQGMQGSGKSTLIEHLVAEQYKAGRGVIILDPHGTLAKHCCRLVPRDRMHQVVFHAPAVEPLGMNILQMVDPHDTQERAMIADRFLTLLAGVSSSQWGDLQADALDSALWTALSRPKATIMDVLDLIEDKGLAARLRKFIRNPVLQAMLTSPPIPFERLMTSGGIYILDLSGLEQKTADFIYSLHVLRIQAAAKGRTEHSRGVLLVMDECQRVASNADEIAAMLAELRKYSISVCLAHHAEVQMSDKLTKFYGLVGTQYLFRLTSDNARAAADIISPIEPTSMTHLPNYHCVRRRQVHGYPEMPRVVKTSKPIEPVLTRDEVIEISRRSVHIYGSANREGRENPHTPSKAQSVHNESTTEILPQLPVHQKTDANSNRGRLPQAVSPADGSRVAEKVGDCVLPF